MDRTVLRRFLPGILFFVGFALIWSTRSQSAIPLVGPIASVLPAVDGYRTTQLKVSDEERKVAGMTDYVARAFWQDSTVAFTTYVGYYDRQTQGKSIHSPRNCLPGAGWEILKADTGLITVAGKQHVVNKYLLKNGSYQAMAFYWYQGRGRVVASEYAVKWNLLRDAAFAGHTEEALVRIVVYMPKEQIEKNQLDRAYADAEVLGAQIGGRVLADVARVLPGDEARQEASAVRAEAKRSATSRVF